MSPPDTATLGPERATEADVDRINRLFADAFTDRYQRDGMAGVRVPLLNPAIWRFALAAAGEGALAWRDRSGSVIAFNMVHRSGREGWMGPLAVRPDRQGEGLGGEIVRAGIERLVAEGARTIGLETMPRTVENIGFYSRLGFRPGHLTVSLTRELRRSGAPGEAERLGGAGREERIRECAALTDRLLAGVDFSREIRLTVEHRLGDATLVRDGHGGLAGFALWHSAPLAEGRGPDELRVLKLVAGTPADFRRLLAAVETHARQEGARRLGVRCQTAFREAYAALIAASYRVHWTDLRMSLEGHEETTPADEGIVFSNWEI